MPSIMEPPPESGEECLRLLDELPSAATSSPAFRRHWPSISASLSSVSASLSHPAFPPSAPLLAPLASALSDLLSVCSSPPLGHLHTVSLLSSSSASLSQLAADARLLVSLASAPDSLLPRLRLGSTASRAAALDSLAETVPASSSAAVISAVAAMLDSGDFLPASRDKAVSVLAALAASSGDACRFLVQESGTVVPHLARALESGGASAQQACLALEPLTASSRDAAAAVASRGGVDALLVACAAGTPVSQAAAAGVVRNIAAFPDLLSAFRREEGALPLLVQLVSLGTPRATEFALGCLQNLTASDSDEGQRLKVEAFQGGALGCVKGFLESCRGDEPGLAPAFGLLRNMAFFRHMAAEMASFVSHVVAALGSDRASTRTEAAMALAELCNCNVGSSKARKEVRDAIPRLVWMLEAKMVTERDAAARVLAALVAASSYRKLFKKDEMGIVNLVQLLDPVVRGVDKRFPVSVLLAVSQSRRCRKQMVAAGACGFLQGLHAAEVHGAKKLSECLGRGNMLGVFPRS